MLLVRARWASNSLTLQHRLRQGHSRLAPMSLFSFWSLTMMRVRSVLAGLTLFAATAGAQTFGGYNMTLNSNGTSPAVTGGVLQLINDQYGASSSAFTNDQFAFTTSSSWTTSFTMHYAWTSGGDIGDGIAFVM